MPRTTRGRWQWGWRKRLVIDRRFPCSGIQSQTLVTGKLEVSIAEKGWAESPPLAVVVMLRWYGEGSVVKSNTSVVCHCHVTCILSAIPSLSQ
jgi:hypothetical protein